MGTHLVAFAMSSFVSAARMARRGLASASRSENPFIAERQVLEHHAVGASELWKKLTFVTMPALFVAGVYLVMTAEHHHPDHKNWPHLHKLDKKFPWGDGTKTLFYTEDVNFYHKKK